MVAASFFSILKDALATVGGLGALIGTFFAIWFALRKRAENKQDRQQHEVDTYRTRLTTLETMQSTDAEFRQHMQQRLNTLGEDVDKVRTRCVQHQQGQNLSEIKNDLIRLSGRLDKIVEDLMKHKDLSAERFLPQQAHYNDLAMVQAAIEALRQNVNDVNSTLAKILTKA